MKADRVDELRRLDCIETIQRQSSIEWNQILAERFRQDRKWGEQNHDPFVWLTILAEEVGEASKAALEARADNMPVDHYRQEIVQVAAVALAMLECLSRGKWSWPNLDAVNRRQSAASIGEGKR